jgi:RimJ/RimL family protein N-acetyltransferase
MLEAYQHPDAFTSSVAERVGLPMSWWETRLERDVVLAAFRTSSSKTSSKTSLLLGVAGLSFDPREKAKHKATVFGVYVSPHARGEGIGQKLVQAVLAHARSLPHLSVVQLTVSEGNPAARALYQRCGFVEFGLEPLAVAVGATFVSKVHMWCDLRTLP